MTILPRANCICPSCFEEIDLLACDIVSGVTTGKVIKKAPRWQLGQIFIESLDGKYYSKERAHRCCPYCDYLLPYNVERVRNISLSVIGDVYSGKSHYVASLVHQLTREWGGKAVHGFLQIICLTPEIERTFKQRWMDPIFNERSRLPATPQAVEQNGIVQPLVDHPLIYKIRISPSRRHPPCTFNLLIYDTSGEDFNDIERMLRFARFSLNSSAFIFVADPFSMDPIFKDLLPSLQSPVPPELRPANRKPITKILDEVLDSFGRDSSRGDVDRLTDIPIAVMVSKADIFTKGLQQPYPYIGFSLNDYPQYDFGVDLNDISNIHKRVEKLLTHYKQDRIISSTNALGKCQFFATSATGVPLDSTDHYPSVKPWRCLDPLLWILYELGFVKNL